MLHPDHQCGRADGDRQIRKILLHVKEALSLSKNEAEVDRFLCSIVLLRFIGPAIVDPSKYSIKPPKDISTKQLQRSSVEAVKLILKVVNGLVESSRYTNREKYSKLRTLALENVSLLSDRSLITEVEQGFNFA